LTKNQKVFKQIKEDAEKHEENLISRFREHRRLSAFDATVPEEEKIETGVKVCLPGTPTQSPKRRLKRPFPLQSEFSGHLNAPFSKKLVEVLGDGTKKLERDCAVAWHAAAPIGL